MFPGFTKRAFIECLSIFSSYPVHARKRNNEQAAGEKTRGKI
jgi:hypothetical protein